MQYQSSCAPKLLVARKCRIEHLLPCGADGQAGSGRAVYGHVVTKFSEMGRFTYGAPKARFARQSSAKKMSCGRLAKCFTKKLTMAKLLKH